jgi:RHS repeat-associated protein
MTTCSFIYGPCRTTIEQINNTSGTVEYLHHDQQGSTRLLTGSTGTVTGKCTYGAYGTPTCEGSATTPLGWDGQYTSSDTGLIYMHMRARVYDPATAQFLTREPLAAISGEPYSYAGDNPPMPPRLPTHAARRHIDSRSGRGCHDGRRPAALGGTT